MKKLKVLVIDDDATTCNLLETILQMEDYQTASVSNITGLDIISLLDQQAPHILILDLHLGSKETLDYITTIHATVAWQQLPILMTSAINRHQECLDAGATGFILKPFNWQELIKAINKIRGDLTLTN